jgi:hypothetical protein
MYTVTSRKGALTRVGGIVLCVLCAFTSPLAQDVGLQLQLQLTIEPLVFKRTDPIHFALTIRNGGTVDVVIPNEIRLLGSDRYGDIFVEFRREGTAEFRMPIRGILEPTFRAKPDTFSDLLVRRLVMILPRDHVHGIDLNREARHFFTPIQPGRYEVRVRYVGSFLKENITGDVTPPVVLPNDSYTVFSNPVIVTITE